MDSMNAMAWLCLIGICIGAILHLFGSILLLIEEFKESIVWGILGLFIGLTHLIFICLHFDKGARPLAYIVGGFVIMIVCYIGFFASMGNAA